MEHSYGAGNSKSIRKIVIKPETAYEVNSCLVDALQSGTGKAAYTQFGLKEIPGGRQDRHSVRFYRRAFCRIRFQFHVRRLGRLR